MSQSNYNIPNQSAPVVRAQLNSVFGSIATNNSGSAAPSTTFAHQWWYDTTTNILKQRNAANSAWIDIGTFDQTGGTFTPSGQRDLASQAEAEAGTDNATVMTPLRTAQAIDAQVVIPPAESYTLLGTLTTTSGSSHTLSGLDLTGYKFLFLSVNAVSPSADTYMRWAANNNHRITTASGGGGVFWTGTIIVDLEISKFSASIGDGSTVASAVADVGYAGPCALTNASTSVRIDVNSGNFDAGSIRIYGVK